MRPTTELRFWMTEATPSPEGVRSRRSEKLGGPPRQGGTDRKGTKHGNTGQDGFPDIVLSRAAVTHFVELKSESGRLTAAQADWLARLSGTDTDCWLDGSRRRVDVPTGIVAVWRPSDWEEVESILNGHEPTQSIIRKRSQEES